MQTNQHAKGTIHHAVCQQAIHQSQQAGHTGAGDLLGRSIELQVPASGGGAPGKHPFSFDKVFGPATGQVTPVLLTLHCGQR